MDKTYLELQSNYDDMMRIISEVDYTVSFYRQTLESLRTRLFGAVDYLVDAGTIDGKEILEYFKEIDKFYAKYKQKEG